MRVLLSRSAEPTGRHMCHQNKSPRPERGRREKQEGRGSRGGTPRSLRKGRRHRVGDWVGLERHAISHTNTDAFASFGRWPS